MTTCLGLWEEGGVGEGRESLAASVSLLIGG